MRGRGHLLLLVLLAGCVGPPPAEEPPAAAPGVATAPSGAPDLSMRVTWTPEHPRPGDMLTIDIHTEEAWPGPRCVMSDVAARLMPLGPWGGGGTVSVPASSYQGRYQCLFAVSDAARGVAFSVTRADGDKLRIFGPRVLEVEPELPRAPLRVPFGSFALDEHFDGLPIATGRVHPALVHVGGQTNAWIQVETIPVGYGTHSSAGVGISWADPFAFEQPIPAGADDYVLLAYAHAENDVAFATSEPAVRGYRGCADGSCIVRDG